MAWALWATFWQEEDSAGPDVGVTLSDVADDPEEYYGQRVVVSGQIDDVLEEDDAIGSDDTGGAGFVLGDEAEFESELGTDLEEGVFEDFDDRPALRATAVSLALAGDHGNQQLRVSLQALEDDPGEFLGSRLTIRETAVEEVISPRVVALSDDVLVVTPAGSPGLADDQAVEVDGRVVEVSTVQLVNVLSLENEDELFTELEVTQDDIDDYEVAVVAGSVTPGR